MILVARPTKLDTMRRDRLFVEELLATGSVHQAAQASGVHPSRLGALLDRPEVRSILQAAA